jgi:antitoxin ParD1/3/4
MPTRSVNLTARLNRFIELRVASGRFLNASEVIREGLRLLEQREREDKAKLKWLRAAAKEGFDALDRGDYTSVHSASEMEEFLNQIHREVSAETAAERK